MFFSQRATTQLSATPTSGRQARASHRRVGLSRHQAGVSILGVLVLLALLSFFLTVTIRLLPSWMEGRSVKAAIVSVGEASTAQNSLRDVTKRIQNNFNTNRIEAIKPRDVKVYRDEGKIIIEANYEKRTPLFKGVDAVLMFNDNVVVIQ